MLLDDKYIVSNKKDLKIILKILKEYGYKKGYVTNGYVDDLNDDLDYVIVASRTNNISTRHLNIYTHDYFKRTYLIIECEKINAKPLIREYKLKRILK